MQLTIRETDNKRFVVDSKSHGVYVFIDFNDLVNGLRTLFRISSSQAISPEAQPDNNKSN